MRLGALALCGAILALAGPALGGHKAPAVWVPMAPAAGSPAGTPIVLVPFRQTVALPQFDRAPAPWLPDYLTAPLAKPVPEAPDLEPASGASFTFSDVVRGAEWRRETARRLRAESDFRVRF